MYNGHLQGPVTLKPIIIERLEMMMSLPVLTIFNDSSLEFEHPTFCLQGERSN